MKRKYLYPGKIRIKVNYQTFKIYRNR